jgi:hypothetical protein
MARRALSASPPQRQAERSENLEIVREAGDPR